MNEHYCPYCQKPLSLSLRRTEHDSTYNTSGGVAGKGPGEDNPPPGPNHVHLSDDEKVRTLVSKALVEQRNKYTAKGDKLPPAAFKTLQKVASTHGWVYKDKDGNITPILNWWINNVFRVPMYAVYPIQEVFGCFNITQYCTVDATMIGPDPNKEVEP